MAAYRELWRRLNIPDGQIVWCYTEYGRRKLTEITEREWRLSVPQDEIVGCIDGLVWNRIIGSRSSVTQKMHREWMREARQLYPADAEAREQHERTRLDQFWNEPEPSDGWWSRLRVPLRGRTLRRHYVDQRRHYIETHRRSRAVHAVGPSRCAM